MFYLKRIFLSFLLSLSFSPLVLAFEGYYQNIDADIEFRVLETAYTDVPIKELNKVNPDILFLEEKAIISSSDILGLIVDNNDFFTIHFNRSSWAKVRRFSFQTSGRRVAFIKNNKILSAPVMHSAIDYAAKLPIPKNLDQEWFLKGFVSKTPPKDINSDDLYILFLKDWLGNHPSDQLALRTLAFRYLPENDLSNCGQAISYLEQILKNEPDDMILGNKLIMCHLELENNEKALKAAENLMLNMPDEVMRHVLIGAIGEIYFRLGEINKAIQQIEIALDFYKTSKASDLADWDTYSPELQKQVKKQYQTRKEETISVYEKTLHRYKKELNKQGS